MLIQQEVWLGAYHPQGLSFSNSRACKNLKKSAAVSQFEYARSCCLLAVLLLSACTISGAATDVEQDVRSDQYFKIIALGGEYGDRTGFFRKWNTDLRIEILGNPTQSDLEALDSVISDLNELTGSVQLVLDGSDPNVRIHFNPERQFKNILPEYRSVNPGFHWVWWDDSGAIHKAEILISTTGIQQQERNHLIREELTQSLGLLGESPLYENSVFYSGWTVTESFSELDRLVIKKMYSNTIAPGAKLPILD